MSDLMPKDTICLMCNGHGRLKSTGKSPSQTYYTECALCNGTGHVPDQASEPFTGTGEPTAQELAIVLDAIAVPSVA